MNTVLIHCNPNYLTKVKELGYDYTHYDEDELTIIVDDVEYKDGNHHDQNNIWEDPDVQLCNHYNIDYDQVYCIEGC